MIEYYYFYYFLFFKYDTYMTDRIIRRSVIYPPPLLLNDRIT